MKKLILLLIILVPALVKAQQYVPFPDSNAIWSEFANPGYSSQTLMGHYLLIIKNKDTLVNNNSFHQLFFSLLDTTFGIDTSLKYCGAYREETKKIYFLPKDSLNEFILYDFTLNLGDTFKYIYKLSYPNYSWSQNQPDSLIVSSVDSILLENGSYRRQLGFTSWWQNEPHNVVDDIRWIEGIGNNKGLLFPIADQPTNGSDNFLGCVTQNSQEIYFSPSVYFNNCYLSIIVDDNNYMTLPEINIFPNPISGTGIIQFMNNEDDLYQELVISDVLGRDIKTFCVKEKNEIQISSDDFKEGLYFVKLITKKGEYFINRLIIQ